MRHVSSIVGRAQISVNKRVRRIKLLRYENGNSTESVNDQHVTSSWECKPKPRWFIPDDNKRKKIYLAESISQTCNIPNDSSTESTSLYRENFVKIQTLSKCLHEKIFSHSTATQGDESRMVKSVKHLADQGLWGKSTSKVPDVDFEIPALQGSNLEEHFVNIGNSLSAPYRKLVENFLYVSPPEMPPKWNFSPGWTRYNADGTFTAVKYPQCELIVFDVEVCMQEGQQPTLATAVSENFWYSWCSDALINCRRQNKEVCLEELISLEGEDISDDPRVVIGHNVGFDRKYVRQQYRLDKTALRFIDTMSLHIAVSGLVEEQRSMLLKNKNSSKAVILPWMYVGSENSLEEVYKFYCGREKKLRKDMRNVFVKGSLSDVKDDFQNLMAYCAEDVQATGNVISKLFPLFLERFPHPVTFAGMLEMGTTYLPVNSNWKKYIELAEERYNTLEHSLCEELIKHAKNALCYMNNEEYKKDPWLWDLDWSQTKRKTKPIHNYPKWYRALCDTSKENETPEPKNMTVSLRVVPKLLKLKWNGFPLHHNRNFGWGYLVPKSQSLSDTEVTGQANFFASETSGIEFPLQQYRAMFESDIDTLRSLCKESNVETDYVFSDFESQEDWENYLSNHTVIKQPAKNKTTNAAIKSLKECDKMDLGIPGVYFVQLPHKDGHGKNVGNPLAKDFLKYLEDNTLTSHNDEVTKHLLKITRNLSYWRNNRDRILSQMVIWFDDSFFLQDIPVYQGENSVSEKYGAILPQVVTAGTITRRAVERTWMTASNAYADRIGSELKALVQAPSGFHFVGADVDSQELWIAAFLGDAYFAKEHGSTALGWMTLQGKKIRRNRHA